MMDENPLSSRESEILELLAQGKSNKEIASDLVISVNTVKVHISNIFQKLGISSRAEAIMYALEKGIIETPRQELTEPQVITEIVEAELPKWLLWLKKYWWIPSLLLIGLIFALSFIFSRSAFLAKPTPSPDPLQAILSQNRWQDLELLKPARTGLAAVAYRNHIYAIGGESLEGISALNQSFNLKTNRWVQLTAKPSPVKNAAALEISGKIYVFGGELADGSTSNVIEVYDTANDTWESKTPAPIGLSRYAATIYEGNIYVFGGWNGNTLSNQTLVYDPSLDKWHTAPSSPKAFLDAFALTANDRIMLLGGKESNGKPSLTDLKAITTLRIFSPDLESIDKSQWSEPLEVFQAKEIIAAQNMGDSIVVFSRLEEEKTLISYYSLQTEAWMHAEGSSSSYFKERSGLANISGAVYFIGGQDESGAFSEDFKRYQAIFSIMLPAIIN